MELGNDASYEIKGVGSTSFLLDSGTILHINDILYVPGLKRNLLSVGVLEDKGYEVIFKQGKTYLWDKDKDLDSVEVIGVCEEGLYKVPGQKIQALAPSTESIGELWHRRLGHLHHKAFPDFQKIVSGMPSISISKNEICKGCMLGKNVKRSFSNSDSRT